MGFAPSREAALAIDGVHATRPIEYPVGPPKEAEGMFDLLTYEKGAAVLRMLEQHIGPEVFRDGVRTYLTAHAYANTVTTDLWDALEEASGEPVRDVMNTFILQGGHPLVSLHGDTLEQQPFSYGPVPDGIESAIGDAWNVPVAVRALPVDGKPGAPTSKLVLDTTPVRLEEAAQGLAVVNAGGWGVFRVGYEAEHRLALADRLSELTPLERANLLADTWATTLAGHSTLEEFLILAAKLGLEPDPTPWAPVVRCLPPGPAHRAEADLAALRQAVAALSARSSDISASSPSRARGIARRRCGRWPSASWAPSAPTPPCAPRRRAASTNHPSAAAAAIRSRPTSRPPRWRWWPNSCGPATTTPCCERYRTATTPQEEMRSLNALSAFPSIDLAQRTFDLAMTEVRSQNGWIVISALLANPVAGQAIWRRVTEAWDAILERFPKNAHARIAEAIPALCGDAAFARSVVQFLADHPLASGPRRVAQSVERLDVNVAFAERERARLGESCRAAVGRGTTA